MPDVIQQFNALVVLALIHAELPEKLAKLLATLEPGSALAALAKRLLRWIMRLATPLLPELQLQQLYAQAVLVNAAVHGITASRARAHGRGARGIHASGMLASAVLGVLHSDVRRLDGGGVVCDGAVDRFGDVSVAAPHATGSGSGNRGGGRGRLPSDHYDRCIECSDYRSIYVVRILFFLTV